MSGLDIALIRGFDLHFEGADSGCIKSIARDLGGTFSNDGNVMSATYMFKKPRKVFVHEIEDQHEILRALAKKYEERYSCTFVASEFYITAPHSMIASHGENPNIDVIYRLIPSP